jgi:DNA-binding CsgD family transcriptional regulator
MFCATLIPRYGQTYKYAKNGATEMGNTKPTVRKFDIQEYGLKIKGKLEKLKTEQQPGQVTGKGNKADVLQAAKLDIQALVAEGYTAKQIADAISDDTFSILPKTITQLIGLKKKADVSRRPAAPKTDKVDSNQISLAAEPKTEPKAKAEAKKRGAPASAIPMVDKD